MHHSGWRRSQQVPYEFNASMLRLKQTEEIVRDGKRARRYYLGSHFLAAVTGALAALALNAWFGDYVWGGKTGLTIAALVAASFTAGFRDAAMLIWQQQDRRYFLGCLRQAHCTADLMDAGLFAHDKATGPYDSAEGLVAFRRAVRALQVQLGDALYFDVDPRIRERHDEVKQAHNWNWSKKGGTQT